MLFGYPHLATRGNWLHACLCRMLRTLHADIQAGNAVPAWPGIIPAAYQARLRAYTGLRDRLQAYGNVYAALQPSDQQAIEQALCRQNRIRRLLAAECNCQAADQLPAGIRDSLLELSKEAFRLLGQFGIRDQQYSVIYQTLNHKVCPFCGLHAFDSPEGPREDLDHYLPRSRYPFAGANLKNLAPTCGRCNSAYKGTADVLWNAGARRTAFYPYDHGGVRVSLSGSRLGVAGHNDAPQWIVSLEPAAPEVDTWDSVYKIRARYVKDVLSPLYESWLREFASFYVELRRARDQRLSPAQAVERFRDFHIACGHADRSFLKAAVFDCLAHHCQQGDQQVIRKLRKTLAEAQDRRRKLNYARRNDNRG